MARAQVVDLFKVVGERRVLAVVEVPPDKLDQLSLDLPIMQEMGGTVDLDVSPLQPYAAFAADLRGLAGLGPLDPPSPAPTGQDNGEGELFWVDCELSQEGLSQAAFFELWAAQAEATLQSAADGWVEHVWKVAGQHRVVSVVRVCDAGDLDRRLFSLPAAKSALGPNLDFTVKALRRYEVFAADVKERLEAEEA